jgi:hypothetical protein
MTEAWRNFKIESVVAMNQRCESAIAWWDIVCLNEKGIKGGVGGNILV